MRSLREALVTFQRSPLLSALSVTTIALSLFALGLFGLVALNIREARARLEDRVEIRAFVAEGTPPEDIAQAASDIASFPEVLRADLVTQEEALKRAQAELGEFRDLFEGAVLPASIDLRLKPGQRDPATVKRVADRVKTYSFIDDVRYGEEWIETLYRYRGNPGSAPPSITFETQVCDPSVENACKRLRARAEQLPCGAKAPLLSADLR
jgi:cell division transport system permease protein